MVDVNIIHNESCLDTLRRMPDDFINCCVTSPPYWGLRDYGVDGQIGLERTPEEYVAKLVEIFAEVRRVLKPDGTFWLNLGDSYVGANNTNNGGNANWGGQPGRNFDQSAKSSWKGLKPKDLVGIPWMVAFALRSDGWWLRQDIIWSKPNPMPESVTDRCTKAHEYVFMLTKSAKYWYDAEAIKTPAKWPDGPNSPQSIKSPHGQGYTRQSDKQRGHSRRHAGFNDRWDQMSKQEQMSKAANRRSVWTIATQPYSEAHFATFLLKLPSLCVLAGCPKDGIVYDPFMGAGTTALAAIKYGRKFIGSELNSEYCAMANKRIKPHLKQIAMPFE